MSILVAKPPAEIIERLEERLEYSRPDNPWVKLYFDRVRFPGGKEGLYNRLIYKGRTEKSVVLFAPFCPGYVGLISLYRYAIGAMSWEFPRATVDEGEEPLDTAWRETMEEVGQRPIEMLPLQELHPQPVLIQGSTMAYAARYEAPTPSEPGDKVEVSEFRWIALPQLWQAVAAGEIRDAQTLAALALLAAKKLI